MGGDLSGGGSLVLASLIDQAGEAIYQDFRSEYQIDFTWAVAGGMAPFEIMLLIRGLKVGSRFVSVLQGGNQFQDWNTLAYQMATLIDAVNYATYAIIAANSKRKPKQPKPTYRPTRETRRSKNMFRTQLEQAKQRKLTQTTSGDK